MDMLAFDWDMSVTAEAGGFDSASAGVVVAAPLTAAGFAGAAVATAVVVFVVSGFVVPLMKAVGFGMPVPAVGPLLGAAVAASEMAVEDVADFMPPLALGGCSCEMLERLSDRDGVDLMADDCFDVLEAVIFESGKCSVLFLASDSRELMLRVEPSNLDLLLAAAMVGMPSAAVGFLLAVAVGGASTRAGCTGTVCCWWWRCCCCCCCWCSFKLRLESLRSLRADEKPLLELVRLEICDLLDAAAADDDADDDGTLSVLLNSFSFSSIDCF